MADRSLEEQLPPFVSEEAAGSLVGQHLGSYELVRFIGRGGMADVYAARHAGIGGRAALKRMLPRLASKPRLVELFFHEARLQSLLSHRNLVRCIDFDATTPVPYMVLELVDGVGCDAIVRWSQAQGVPARIALAIIRGVLAGLGHAHEATDAAGTPLQIVHHDVSLDNVLIDSRGEVRLLDFGVARSQCPGGASDSELRGKLCYMAPEQIAGHRTDPRCDLFSVGVVLTELLLGRHLFSSRDELSLLLKTYEVDLEALEPAIGSFPSGVVQLLHRAIEREPAHRFQSAREFCSALDEVTAELGGLPDASELTAWLRSKGLLSEGSGVHERAIPSMTAPVLEKLEAARPALSSLASESRRAPTPSTRGLAAVVIPPRSYLLQSPDTGEVREIELTELVELLVTARANADTLVSDDSEHFKRVGELPAFSFLAQTPAYCFDDGTEHAATWSAPLSRRELPSAFFALAARRARGVLSFSAGTRKKRIYFDNGAPVFVASTDPSELLGACLVRRGFVDGGRLRAVLALATRQRRHLGEALVAARYVSSGEVVRVLVDQLRSRVLDVGDWMVGQVAFTRGPRPGVRSARPLGPRTTLACELVRTAYIDREVERFLSRVSQARLAPAGDPPVHPAELPLTTLEHEILGQAAEARDFPSLVRRMAERGRATPANVRRAVFLGLSAGLLASPAWEMPFPPSLTEAARPKPWSPGIPRAASMGSSSADPSAREPWDACTSRTKSNSTGSWR